MIMANCTPAKAADGFGDFITAATFHNTLLISLYTLAEVRQDGSHCFTYLVREFLDISGGTDIPGDDGHPIRKTLMSDN